ncbi:MAG: bacteriohemerythrin [bacterium]
MNNKIVWSDMLCLGVKEIDEQHKDVVQSVNDLYDAIEEDMDRAIIIELIEKLDTYINNHFNTEESYMKLYNFKDINNHQAAHANFKNVYEKIRYNYYYLEFNDSPKKELTRVFAIHLCSTMFEWLHNHLIGLDKDFAEFLNTKQNK